MKILKCPFCDKKYKVKSSLYNHMEELHDHLLLEGKNKEPLPASQVYFNFKNNYTLYKKNGKCIICNKFTDWNDHVEKYNRLCNDPKCSEKYRDEFKKRMLKVHGKTHLLDDPEQQKLMLANRKISGEYNYKNSKKFTYTGNLELEFLKFLDHVLDWHSSDIIMPAPQIFRYEFEGKEKFHIPDVYIQSLNLIVNIKSKDNKHYRLRDINQEKFIDTVVSSSKYNYLKIYDGDHSEFINFIKKLKDGKK